MENYKSNLSPMLAKRARDRKIKALVIKYVVKPLGLDDWFNKLFAVFLILCTGFMLAALITHSVGAPIASVL